MHKNLVPLSGPAIGRRRLFRRAASRSINPYWSGAGEVRQGANDPRAALRHFGYVLAGHGRCWRGLIRPAEPQPDAFKEAAIPVPAKKMRDLQRSVHLVASAMLLAYRYTRLGDNAVFGPTAPR